MGILYDILFLGTINLHGKNRLCRVRIKKIGLIRPEYHVKAGLIWRKARSNEIEEIYNQSGIFDSRGML